MKSEKWKFTLQLAEIIEAGLVNVVQQFHKVIVIYDC